MGGVGSRHASGLGDEGWRRACDSKKGKNMGWRKWGQNTMYAGRQVKDKRHLTGACQGRGHRERQE